MKRHPQTQPFNPWNISADQLAIITASLMGLTQEEAIERAFALWRSCQVYLTKLRVKWDKEHK